MQITFYAEDGEKSFTLRPIASNKEKPNEVSLWVARESGEGGAFNAEEIANVIYKALDKYFEENF